MDSERLSEQVNDFLNERLNEAGRRELEKLLEVDEEARRSFVRAVDQHQALADLLGATRVVEVVRPRRLLLWAAGGALAASVLVVAGVTLLGRNHPPEPAGTPPPVAGLPPPERPMDLPPAPVDFPAPPAPVGGPETAPEPPTPSVPAVVPETAPEPPVSAPLREAREPTSPKPSAPQEPHEPPRKPSPPSEPQPVPPPPPQERSVAAVATLEFVEGTVYVLEEADKKRAQAGAVLVEGQGVETGTGRDAARLRFPDGTVVYLDAGTRILEILEGPATGKRLNLAEGLLVAEVTRQPRGRPMEIATPAGGVTIHGTTLRLAADPRSTRVEVKEGKARVTRFPDGKAVEVPAGHYAVVAGGIALVPQRITRGPMMAPPAIWGEDFNDPPEVEKDWRVTRNNLAATYKGVLEFELRTSGEAGDAWFQTLKGYDGPLRVSADVEITHRLRGALVGMRLISWKGETRVVHCDLDENFYYLDLGGRSRTAPHSRKVPRRERWSVEVEADGTVLFSVDGRELLKDKTTPPAREYHLTLMAKGETDAAPGARARFDNVVIEPMVRGR